MTMARESLEAKKARARRIITALERAYPDDHGMAGGQSLEQLAIDVRDEITESIDAYHFSLEALGGVARPRHLEPVHRPGGTAERRQLDAVGQPGCSRRETIASFKRGAHGWTGVPGLAQLHDACGRVLVKDD